MTATSEGTTRSRRVRRLGAGVAVVVVAAVVVVVLLLRDSPEACGCAIPPDDDDAIATARDYVTALAGGDNDLASSMLDADAEPPDDERAARLAALADPATAWFVVGLHRPDGGHGEAPAERVIVGLTPDGAWDAFLVRTDRDYEPGRVDVAITVGGDIPPVARAGDTPIFGDLDVAATSEGSLTLVAPGGEPEPVESLRGGDWAYTGPGLSAARYLVVEVTYRQGRESEPWRVEAGWYEVAG